MFRLFLHNRLLTAALLAAIFTFGCKEENKPDTTETEDIATTFTDERDGKVYKYVKIGELTWMAENLNYEAEGSKCYNNYPDYCEKYGRLYDWQTALKVCPNGWHLPKKEEWDALYKFVDISYVAKYGTSEIAEKYFKSKTGWKDGGYVANEYGFAPMRSNENGEDKYGFAALPGGYGSSNGDFKSIGYYGFWWSASDYNTYNAYRWCMGYQYKENNWPRSNGNDKIEMYSVRCVRD